MSLDLNSKLVIWTRACGDWKEDSLILEQLPASIYCLPCISTRSLKVDVRGLQIQSSFKKIVILTSWRSAFFALQNEAIKFFFRDARIFALGVKTERFLREEGFDAEVVEGIRTAEQLFLFLSRSLSKNSYILLPGPRLRAFNLEREFRKAGFQCQSIEVYETLSQMTRRDGRLHSLAELEEIKRKIQGLICFCSPSAVQAFSQALTPKENRLFRVLKAVALGPTTAKACEGVFARIETCPENDLESFIGFIRGILEVEDPLCITP